MLWQRTSVFDPQDAKTVYVSYLAAVQPDLAKEIYRATVSDEPIGFYNARNVLVGKVDGQWTLLGAAEDLPSPQDHPFLKIYENGYLSIARNILALLNDEFLLEILIDTETDSDLRSKVTAGIMYTAKTNKKSLIYPDESCLDHVPGARYLERNADFFADAMGVESDPQGFIPGDFIMQVGLDSLSLKYQIGDWALAITSGLADGNWSHEVAFTTPSLADLNILDVLKFEAKSSQDKLAFSCTDSPFNLTFPKLAQAEVPVIEVRQDEAGRYVYRLDPAELR
jgi:hypothetical protein